MNAQELRTKNDDELQKMLLDLLKEQFNLRMQKGAGDVARHHFYRRVRRDIARVKTIINEKERQA